MSARGPDLISSILLLFVVGCGGVTSGSIGKGAAGNAGNPTESGGSSAAAGGASGAGSVGNGGITDTGGRLNSTGGVVSVGGTFGTGGAASDTGGVTSTGGDGGAAPDDENRSCLGLANCGADSCCSSPLVAGGTFYPGYDGATYTNKFRTATVSDFRLDQYEITVGRFRRFVANYSRDMIAEGSGKNPNNPSDPGWSGDWNAILPVDAAALMGAVKCGAPYQTWTDLPGANEDHPMNCLSWYEAFAFCIWDGGRLPTEVEWNYTAAGGNEQRLYPWGSAAPDCTYANFYGTDIDYCVRLGTGRTSEVGSLPNGRARWGHLDMAGNVWEWMLDYWAGVYPPEPCVNCANMVSTISRVLRSGGFDSGPEVLLCASRSAGAFTPSEHYGTVGARCAY